MKTIAIILFLSPIWALNSLGQDKEVSEFLNNVESRTVIFNEILNDHQLMMEFMDAMKDNKHAMMMWSDSSMMGMNDNQSEMMHQMMSKMKQNPDLMQSMMGNMMDMCERDSTHCKQMAEVMSEHPHMMMMGMQKMKEKESGESNDTNNHHMHK